MAEAEKKEITKGYTTHIIYKIKIKQNDKNMYSGEAPLFLEMR